MKKLTLKSERLMEDDSFTLHKSKGNGILRRQVWCDNEGNITRYCLAYINHTLFQGDNGRVLGYDNAHGYHHKHYYGKIEEIKFKNFLELEEAFQNEFEVLHEKLKENKELFFKVKTETLENFFARGKNIAKLIDEGIPLKKRRIISFEDPKDLINFLSETKMALLKVIRKKPDSISKLAQKLHRSRAAIDKDVQLLEAVGIVKSEYVTNPGHGRCRIIKAVDAEPVKLYVETLM